MNKDEKIEYAKYIMEEITSTFLKKGRNYVILEGYEYIREVITLYAKQSNLFESTLLLLENNHAEEAYILLRSMLNNSMLIEYLCNDNENRDRYKNYMAQPTKSQLSFFYDVRRAVKQGWLPRDPKLAQRIGEHKQYLINKGFKYEQEGITYADTSLLKIKPMALEDEVLFGHYIQFYREASQYEHSDFSSLDIYRQPYLDGYSNREAFTLDLSRTSIELGETILSIAVAMYTLTFSRILQHMLNKHTHLILEEDIPDLTRISLIISANEIHFPYLKNEEELTNEGAEH
ncbi:UNVERIFIED_ORG: hypothetical protein J2X74_003835 [Bacillus sp. 1751]|nr:hypothetical protein [Bacillus sp. 1751]